MANCWYEIATLSYQGSREEFLNQLFAKGQAIGVVKLILSWETVAGALQHYTWGCLENTDLSTYIQVKKKAPNVIYKTMDHDGRWSRLLVELKQVPSPGEKPLVRAYTNRIVEAVRYWQLQGALQENKRIKENWKDLLESLMNNSGVGFYFKNLSGAYQVVNSFWADLLAKEAKEVLGDSDSDLLPKGKDCLTGEKEEAVLATASPEHYLREVKLPDDKEAWLMLCNYPVFNKEQELVGVGGIAQDITFCKKAEERILHDSSVDRLTGLYNRNYLEEQMDTLALDEENFPISIIIVDINDLKVINDTWGHDQGDRLLREVGHILKDSLGHDGVAARFGGDEFVALLPRTQGKEAEAYCQKIRSSAKEHSGQRGFSLPIDLSMGLATCYGPRTPLAETFKEADKSLYLDKLRRTGKTRNLVVSAFTTALQERGHFTYGQSERLERLIVGFGECLGLSQRQIGELTLLSAIRDLGYIAIPDKVLFKSEYLSREERLLVESHVEIGYRVASALPDLDWAAQYILQHHEWWDGNGYPLGKSGEEIPLYCRIMAIIDAYDAMTTQRPYRQVMVGSAAVEELQKAAGRQFDPALVEKFVEYIESIQGES